MFDVKLRSDSKDQSQKYGCVLYEKTWNFPKLEVNQFYADIQCNKDKLLFSQLLLLTSCHKKINVMSAHHFTPRAAQLARKAQLFILKQDHVYKIIMRQTVSSTYLVVLQQHCSTFIQQVASFNIFLLRSIPLKKIKQYINKITCATIFLKSFNRKLSHCQHVICTKAKSNNLR